MINGVTMRINIDEYLLNALKEDITSEDVTTNAVMPEAKQGKVDLICKEDGIICGLEVFERVFKLLDELIRFRFCFVGFSLSNSGLLIQFRFLCVLLCLFFCLYLGLKLLIKLHIYDQSGGNFHSILFS